MSEVKKKKGKVRFIVNLAIVVVLAVMSGFFAGNYYVKNYTGAVLAVTETEEAVRGNDVVNALKKAKGKTPADLTSVENFVLAEHYLNQKDFVMKKINGVIESAGVKQGLSAYKALKDGYVLSEKVSASKFVKVADRFLYKIGDPTVKYYKGSNITSDFTASWSNKPENILNMDQYKEKYGAKPEAFISYVVGTNTTIAEGCTAPKKLANGNYECKIQLDTYYSGMNYMYEIRTTSGSGNFPKFEEVFVTFEITPDWDFVKIHYEEKYYVSIAVLGYTLCYSDLTDTFDYVTPWENPLV